MNALLDANVLYSIVLTDVLLCMAEDSLYFPVWTEQVLQEAEQAVIARGRDDSDSVRQRFRAMREAFPGAMVDVEDYQHIIAQMRCDEKDRHVLAAGVAAQVDVLVTANQKHFPRQALAGLPVGGIATPDTFLCAMYRGEPVLVETAMSRWLSRKTQPPLTLRDLADRLARSGAPSFAALLAAAPVLAPRNP